MKPLLFTRRIDLASGVAVQAGAVVPSDKPRRFDIQAYDGGPLPVAGFDLPVIVDLSTLEVPVTMPLLIDHEATVEATLGCTDLIENTQQSLRITGLVTATSAKAVGVVQQFDKGQQWQASIGVRVGDLQEIAAGQVIVVNKQSFRGPVLVARNSQMFETSVLPAGADWTTTVNLAARAALLKGTAAMSFEDWVKSLGIDHAAMTEDNRAALTLAFDAAQNPTVPATAPVAAAPVPVPAVSARALQEMQAKAESDMVAGMAARAAKEMSRQAEIAVIAKDHPNIMATAIKDGWEPIKAENAVLHEKVKQNKAPDGFIKSGAPAITEDILTAAVCMTRRTRDHEKQFAGPVLDAAHKHFPRGIGLQQLFLHAAGENGYSVGRGEKITDGNFRTIMNYAKRGPGSELHAAFSTLSLPNILSNVANKELLTGYMEEDMTWREIAAVKSVSDFKTVTSYRLLDDVEYDLIGPGGKFTDGALGEETFTRKALTYGKRFSLTRQDIINDDMGAFDDLKARIGRGSAKKLNSVFWTLFINNSAFFTSGLTNYISGATTNLGADGVGLGLGVKAFRTMTTPTADGAKRVGGRPEILLVPPELEAIAETLYRSTNLGSVKASDANIYANKYRPVTVWQLSDSTFTGYSTTAWYLMANPSYLASIVVSFLNGQETPTVEAQDSDFSELGVQFRGYHDFGVDMAEYLAGIKSKGAA